MVRRNLALQAVAPPSVPTMPLAQAPAVPSRTATPEVDLRTNVKEEPIDPLKLDLGAEELAFKAEVVPDEKVSLTNLS